MENLFNDNRQINLEVYNDFRSKIADGLLTETDLILAINNAVITIEDDVWNKAANIMVGRFAD